MVVVYVTWRGRKLVINNYREWRNNYSNTQSIEEKERKMEVEFLGYNLMSYNKLSFLRLIWNIYWFLLICNKYRHRISSLKAIALIRPFLNQLNNTKLVMEIYEIFIIYYFLRNGIVVCQFFKNIMLLSLIYNIHIFYR